MTARDYPRRHLNDYDERHKGQAALVARSVWSLADAEVAKLEAAFGQDCLTSRMIEIEKRYEPGTFGTVPLDEPKILKHLIHQAGCTPEEDVALSGCKTVKALHDHIAQLGDGVSASLKALLAQLAGYPGQNMQALAWTIVQMPKFMYFSNYDRMSGDVSIEKLK